MQEKIPQTIFGLSEGAGRHNGGRITAFCRLPLTSYSRLERGNTGRITVFSEGESHCHAPQEWPAKQLLRDPAHCRDGSILRDVLSRHAYLQPAEMSLTVFTFRTGISTALDADPCTVVSEVLVPGTPVTSAS